MDNNNIYDISSLLSHHVVSGPEMLSDCKHLYTVDDGKYVSHSVTFPDRLQNKYLVALNAIEGVGHCSSAKALGEELLNCKCIANSGSEIQSRLFISRVLDNISEAMRLVVIEDEREDRGFPDSDCLTVTGQILDENLKNVTFSTDQDVIYTVSDSITSIGVIRQNETLGFYETDAIGFDYVELCQRISSCDFINYIAVAISELIREEDTVVLLEYQRPQDGLEPYEKTSANVALCKEKAKRRLAFIVDDRFSGESGELSDDRVEGERAIGGPVALFQDGNLISINVIDSELNFIGDDGKLEKSRAGYTPVTHYHQSGTLWKYSKQAELTRTGAMAHAGGREKVVCYADI